MVSASTQLEIFFSLDKKWKPQGIEVIHKRGCTHSFFTQRTVKDPATIQVDSCTSADLWCLLSMLGENIYYTLAFQNVFTLMSSICWGCSDVSDLVYEMALEYKQVKLFPWHCFLSVVEGRTWIHPGFVVILSSKMTHHIKCTWPLMQPQKCGAPLRIHQLCVCV